MKKTTMRSLSAIMIILSIFSVIAGCSAKPGADKSSGVSTGDQYIVSKRGWAAFDPGNLKLLMENYNNEEYVKDMFEKKAILPLKLGIKVNMVEDHGGIVRVQLPENNVELWTFRTVLEKT